MSLIFEESNRTKALEAVAERMMIAARTAPKGKGFDNLVMALAEGEEIEKLAAKMRELVERKIAPEFFLRDAENLLAAEVVVLIGTKIRPLKLPYCGLCGFSGCAEKLEYPEHPCAFNTGDLGIAIGSAVSVAMEARVDNRIMYTAGMAAKELRMLGEDVKIIYTIPLSCQGKNPFFDRVWPRK